MSLSKPRRPSVQVLVVVLLSVLLGACGGSPQPRYVEVETKARSVEQAPPGQTLMHAAPPAQEKANARLSLGGSITTAAAPGQGESGAALYQDDTMAAHAGFIVARKMELSVIARRAAHTAGTGGEGVAPAPEAEPAMQYGLRLRGAPGGDRFQLGMALETGARQVNFARGADVNCDVMPTSVGFVHTTALSDCRANRSTEGQVSTTWDPYINVAVYPTLRIGESLHFFVGGGLDSVLTGQTHTEVIRIEESGAQEVVERDTEEQSRLVVLALAGVDARLFENVGFLVNVQMPFGEACLPGPVIEGAISFAF